MKQRRKRKYFTQSRRQRDNKSFIIKSPWNWTQQIVKAASSLSFDAQNQTLHVSLHHVNHFLFRLNGDSSSPNGSLLSYLPASAMWIMLKFSTNRQTFVSATIPSVDSLITQIQLFRYQFVILHSWMFGGNIQGEEPSASFTLWLLLTNFHFCWLS